MPEGLSVVLAFIGVLCIAAGVVQLLLTPLMGRHTANNVRALGLQRQADWWTPERAQRMSRIGALVFAILGGILLLTSGVVWLLSA